MATLTNFQAYRIQAYAVLYPDDVPVRVDILRFHTSWACNSIPSAAMQLALGRDIVDGQIAEIHRMVDELHVSIRAEIYMRVKEGANSFGFSFEEWPDGDFIVFQGVITSTGYTRQRSAGGDSITFNIGMAHFLAHLNSSSCLTRSTHTLTPQQLSGLAAFRLGQGVGPGFLATGLADGFFTPANIDEDLWGLALGPWLQEICQQDILTDDEDPELEHNAEGLTALNAFEPFVYADEDSPDGEYRFGVPLSLPISGLSGAEALAMAIAEDVGQDTFESFASTTLWDKMIGSYAANYDFRIVPLVSSALVVPQIAGQRTPWQTIYPSEFAAIDIASQPQRPVKGVRLFTGFGSMTGVMGGLRLGEAAQPAVLGGQYDNPDFENGMIIYANAPRWAANIAAPHAFGQDAAAPFGLRGNAMFPGVGVPPRLPNPADLVNQAGNLWDLVARAMYIKDGLRGRLGSLQGKLRFDIAPGSTVEIRGVEDKFVSRQLEVLDGRLLYAEVQGVGISVDAEAQSASTTFQLANVRTFVENSLDASSIDQHPFYENAWNGAPLAENLEFTPEPNLEFE